MFAQHDMKTESRNIMIVEDEMVVAHFIRDWLTHFGFHVSGIAVEYESAIALSAQEEIDLVIMDIHIKGERDGIETARKLGKPVVYITAYDDDLHFNRAMESNPLGYLLKPFDERDLKILVNLAFDKIKKGKELIESTREKKGKHSASTDRTGLAQFDPEEIQRMERRLNRLLTVDKVYRDSELDLSKLAKMLECKPWKVSLFINEHLKIDFRDLIAGYRIKEVQEALLDDGDRSILRIALDAGFDSRSTFYRAFLNQVGMTPSEFREKKKHRF